MALFLKNQGGQSNNSVQVPIIDQWIKVVQSADGTPAGAGINVPTTSSTGRIFRVFGGKVKIRAFMGIVTTVIQSQAHTLKISVAKLSDAAVVVGTAVDVSNTADINALEVGGHYYVEGDGTAAILSNAGAVYVGPNGGEWIAEQGQIYVTSGAATTSGKIRWECWYQPLDKGAYVSPEVLASGLLQVKI